MSRLVAVVGARVDGVLYTSDGPRPASGFLIEGDTKSCAPFTNVGFLGARALIMGRSPRVVTASNKTFDSKGRGVARVGDSVVGDSFVGRITTAGQTKVHTI